MTGKGSQSKRAEKTKWFRTTISTGSSTCDLVSGAKYQEGAGIYFHPKLDRENKEEKGKKERVSRQIFATGKQTKQTTIINKQQNKLTLDDNNIIS